MFIDLIAEMKTEWIKMPETPEELEKVTQDFEKWHFHGCCGSMDVVHIGWDRCPAELRIVFENGKEKHPTVAFQVIGSHRRQILNVSIGYPGTRNDKQIVKVDEFPAKFHSSDHWLSNQH